MVHTGTNRSGHGLAVPRFFEAVTEPEIAWLGLRSCAATTLDLYAAAAVLDPDFPDFASAEADFSGSFDFFDAQVTAFQRGPHVPACTHAGACAMALMVLFVIACVLFVSFRPGCASYDLFVEEM
jgi:hypothetical protein